MGMIEWTPDLAVGHEAIDDQHKKLFKAADDLAEAMWQGRGIEEVGKTVDFLLQYTRTHFQDEERLMTSHDYPGFAVQKRAHEKFTSDIEALRDQLSSGKPALEESSKVLNKVCDWFRTHIRTLDTELGAYIKAR